MPNPNETIEAPVVVDDRRAAISAAFDTVEKASASSTETPPAKAEPAVAESEPTGGVLPPGNDESKPVEGVDAEEKPDEGPKFSVDKAPQSWRGPQKAKWATLDPDVRQEVVRREREITTALSESAGARKLAQQFQQVVQPYTARFQSLNAHPLQAIQGLLNADHVLSTAPKVQRAQLVAKLISDYDVDIETLDLVLAGKKLPDEVDDKVEALVQKRLQPFQQFMTQAQKEQSERAAAAEAEYAKTVKAMETDEVKYPFFTDVRQDMADIIEFQSKKGVYLSLEQAYNRAIAMNPDLSSQVASRLNEQPSAEAAAHARAQAALKASKSVKGAPGTVVPGASKVNDRRATIAAALDAAGR